MRAIRRLPSGPKQLFLAARHHGIYKPAGIAALVGCSTSCFQIAGAQSSQTAAAPAARGNETGTTCSIGFGARILEVKDANLSYFWQPASGFLKHYSFERRSRFGSGKSQNHRLFGFGKSPAL